MNVLEALRILLDRATTPEEIEVEYIAMRVEWALRASAQEMAETPTRVEAGDWLVDQCVNAGVAAMRETGRG